MMWCRYPFARDGLEGLTGELHMWHWGGQTALVREITPGRYAAIIPMVDSWMFFTGDTALRGEFYDNRWTYDTRDAAIEGLAAWDGQGHPPGWSYHPRTRRWNPERLNGSTSPRQRP